MMERYMDGMRYFRERMGEGLFLDRDEIRWGGYWMKFRLSYFNARAVDNMMLEACSRIGLLKRKRFGEEELFKARSWKQRGKKKGGIFTRRFRVREGAFCWSIVGVPWKH